MLSSANYGERAAKTRVHTCFRRGADTHLLHCRHGQSRGFPWPGVEIIRRLLCPGQHTQFSVLFVDPPRTKGGCVQFQGYLSS